MSTNRLGINIPSRRYDTGYCRNDEVLFFLWERVVLANSFERTRKRLTESSLFSHPATTPAWFMDIVVKRLLSPTSFERSSREGPEAIDKRLDRPSPKLGGGVLPPTK